MVFSRSSWHCLTVLAALCLVPLGLGCGGKKSSDAAAAATEATITGTVTYTRKPLVFNADGTPLGLESDATKFTSLPLRGVSIRIYQGTVEPTGSGTTVWKVIGATTTGSDGTYTATVPVDMPTFVEIVSTMTPVTGSNINVLAASVPNTNDDPPLADRARYILRKGVDGNSPSGEQTPGSLLSADAKVDFAIDLTKPWWVGPLPGSENLVKTVATGANPATTWVPNVALDTTGAGSRVAAILDSAYTFGSVFGNPAPGATLFLHYQPGTADLRPSSIEYDLGVYPATKKTGAYFGTIRGAAANDDAWDEGVLFQLFARNWMFSQHFTNLMPTTPRVDRSDLQDLRPEMALMEGFSQAVAAILLKSPYLVDTDATTTGISSVLDIRYPANTGADAYSAANIAALAWKLNLYANGTLTGGVVTPADDRSLTGRAALSLNALNRFFLIAEPVNTTTTLSTDTASIYGQIARLAETRGSTDALDLQAFFPDATLTPLVKPFGITWPRPLLTATPLDPDAGFLADWGADPDSVVQTSPIKLSMAKSQLNGLLQPIYPNFSKGEIYTAQFTRTKDRLYKLTLQGISGLTSGAYIEVLVDGSTLNARQFYASGSQNLALISGPVPPATTAVLHRIQFRMISPGAIQPDQTFTVRLDAQ